MTTSSVENIINLKTLQRVDSSIIEILDNACQVAIYKYERKLEKWEETDVEGTLFLYRRTSIPHHGFIIVNRMSTTNFVESITDDMQFKLQEPYLLYKNHSGDIIGSWFYEHKDLQRISEKILSIVLKPASPLKRQRCASESESHEENQHILDLLSEAHLQYTTKANNVGSQCRDDNNLNICLEKKLLEKSVPAVKKQENEGHVYSFEENYPVSPRRRFMSTGSFDPDRVDCLSRMRSARSFKKGNIPKGFLNEGNSNNLNVKFDKSLDNSTDCSKAPTDCLSRMRSAQLKKVQKDFFDEDNPNLNVKSSKVLDHSTDCSNAPHKPSAQIQMIKMANVPMNSSKEDNANNLNVMSSTSSDCSIDCSKALVDHLSCMRSSNKLSAQFSKLSKSLKGSSKENNANHQNVRSNKASNHTTDCSKAPIMEERSFDSHRADYFSSMQSANQLSADLIKLGYDSKDSPNGDYTNHRNIKSNKSSHHSTCYNKASLIDEASNLNKATESRLEIYADENDAKNLKYYGHQSWQNNITEHSHIHFESIQSAMKVHIQENPRMLVKIHEAYVSSLKSLLI